MTRTLISILILIFAVLIVVGSCATSTKVYITRKTKNYMGYGLIQTIMMPCMLRCSSIGVAKEK